MDANVTKPKRGGARKGAGRRSVGASTRLSVGLTAEQHATAVALGGGNAAAGIRCALLRAATPLRAIEMPSFCDRTDYVMRSKNHVASIDLAPEKESPANREAGGREGP